MTERSNDMDWLKFIDDNKERILESFSQLYNEITDEEDADKDEGVEKKEDDEGNFFALKELMKLQYQMLTTKDKCFKSMQEHWTNDKQCLR